MQKLDYVSSFECKACGNVCHLWKVDPMWRQPRCWSCLQLMEKVDKNETKTQET